MSQCLIDPQYYQGDGFILSFYLVHVATVSTSASIFTFFVGFHSGAAVFFQMSGFLL
jgi:hypothetical protein